MRLSSVDSQLIFVNPRSGLRTVYNAIYMLGMLFGSYIFGWLSDSYGRMKALMVAVITVSLSGFFGYVGYIIVKANENVNVKSVLCWTNGATWVCIPTLPDWYGWYWLLHGLLCTGC